MKEKTLEELATELKDAFKELDQHDIDYPHSSGLVKQHHVWKKAREIAKKVDTERNKDAKE